MRILVVTLLQREPDGRTRLFGKALQSILNLRWNGALEYYQLAGGDNPIDPSGTVVRKYQQARRVFLQGSYDAMLCAEHDMIVPADALQKLVALESDIAYSLYCWRHLRYDWSAYTELTEGCGLSLSKNPEAARAAWGGVMDVAGIGQGCTLIKRHVLEALDFRYHSGVSCDWTLALDAKAAGYSQRCDLSIICGHMSLLPSPLIVWPDIHEESLHRIEFIA